jgi:glutathione S-transferase
MCEDHLYWLAVCDRWLDDVNFQKGPALFFFKSRAGADPPADSGCDSPQGASERLCTGLSRHSKAERAELARRGMTAAASLLADKPFLFGDSPRGADATLGAFVMGVL